MGPLSTRNRVLLKAAPVEHRHRPADGHVWVFPCGDGQELLKPHKKETCLLRYGLCVQSSIDAVKDQCTKNLQLAESA